LDFTLGALHNPKPSCHQPGFTPASEKGLRATVIKGVSVPWGLKTNARESQQVVTLGETQPRSQKQPGMQSWDRKSRLPLGDLYAVFWLHEVGVGGSIS
jgi:hypothetical protein